MRRNDRADTARITCACHLHWQVAERCDHDVVNALLRQEKLDAVYTLNYVSVFSEFFAFVRLIELWDDLAALLPEKKERWMIPTLPLILIYLQQHIAGLPSVNAVEEVLLTDEPAMRMAGFNAHQMAPASFPSLRCTPNNHLSATLPISYVGISVGETFHLTRFIIW